MPVKQVLRIKTIIRFDVCITPNSHDYPKKNPMVLVGRINVSIVGMKGLKSLISERRNGRA